VVVNSTPAYTGSKNVDADVQVDIYAYARNSAIHFLEALGGEGKITQVLTIPGTIDNDLQKSAVDCVLKFYPKVELLDSQHGQFATPQTKKIADAWVQRFPDIDGVFSMYAEASLGVVRAFEQAGRLDQIKVSPGNQGNGWLKFLATHPKQNLGGVTYPVTLGGDAVKVAAKMLNGESVLRGTFLGSKYLTPEEQAALAKPDEPDSYWPNDLSPEYQPK
jgi:ABC-type sugar transport system substrate-binding protein